MRLGVQSVQWVNATAPYICTRSQCIVNPIGLEKLQWKFYFVYIAILVLECLSIYFLFVETKGPTLEEIAHLFDGDDANIGGKISADQKVSYINTEHIETVDNKEV